MKCIVKLGLDMGYSQTEFSSVTAFGCVRIALRYLPDGRSLTKWCPGFAESCIIWLAFLTQLAIYRYSKDSSSVPTMFWAFFTTRWRAFDSFGATTVPGCHAVCENAFCCASVEAEKQLLGRGSLFLPSLRNKESLFEPYLCLLGCRNVAFDVLLMYRGKSVSMVFFLVLNSEMVSLVFVMFKTKLLFTHHDVRLWTSSQHAFCCITWMTDSYGYCPCTDLIG